MPGMEWTVEIILVALLAATLYQALRLERALGVLKRDRASLESLVVGFNTSTTQAESGIQQLRAAADGTGRQIETQLARSTSLKDDLVFLTERADRLADRLETLVRSARPLTQDRRQRSSRPRSSRTGSANIGPRSRRSHHVQERQPGRARPAAGIAVGSVMETVRPPRLLPTTIATLAMLLVMKCVILLQAAVNDGARPDGMMVASANAASTETGPEHGKGHAAPEHGKPEAKKAEHGKPEHGKEAPAAQQPPVAEAPPVPEGPPPVSESERALLQDLRQRRQELDARAAAFATRESVLAATEQKLTARVGELQSLQKKLETLDGAQKQKEDAGWQGLVKLYEAMKPKDAATIFNDLSMPVLLQVLDRMKDAKAALVMASMNPDKARDVTTELAQLRTGRDAPHQPPIRANASGG